MAKRREVYKLTDMAQIRFKPESANKPSSILKLQEVKGWTQKIIQIAGQKIFKTSPASNHESSIKVPKGVVVDLSLAAYLNSELMLVGNSSKLDLIHIDINKEESEVEIRLLTQFFPTYAIKTITIQRKKQFVLFNGDNYIELYVLDSKSHSLIKKFIHHSPIEITGIQLIGDNCLLEYHHDHVNILGLQNWQPQVMQQISYGAPQSYKVFKIPTGFQNYGNIFLYDSNQYLQAGNEDAVTLYTCQIIYENSQFRKTQLQRFYQLQKVQLQSLIIYNYDINTVLFNFGSRITVIKKHYPINDVTINHKDLHSQLYFLQNRNILHVCDKMVQSYALQVLSNNINIKCFDCITFSKPLNSLLLTPLSLHEDKFILVYKLNNKLNTKETRYWITTTIETSIKMKLESIFKRAKNDKKQVFQSASKMGMSRNQIFYELWMQSNRKSKEDFDILLQSEDYKTITDGVWNVLKKESISFKQLVRIERECFEMLKDQIAKNPTQTNIVQYLKCSFSLRKYRVEKRLETEKKKRKSSQVEESSPMQIQLSIQQYQDIRKRNIKLYILDLMKKQDQSSIIIIRYMVDIFKLTLRYIFPSFMRQIIGELKQGLLELLKVYPQMLPLPPNEGKIYSPSTHGVWADVLRQQWEDNIYFQNLQNIDNIKMLQSLMNKDYFKWDWLVEHDFFKIKRAQFENTFKQNRDKNIFYIFFSQLFVKVTDPKVITQILALVESKYMIPQHLRGKTRLYWQLHQFFRQSIPDYNLSFEDFLSLKEDEIYRIIFSKNKKALVLKEIKNIYNSVCPPQIYDQSILCYFKADYSSLADLKYLLNRVNSEKEQFHSKNQNLYKILVEAAHYKLRWQGSQDLPSNQLIVYYESISFHSQQINKLTRIQTLNRHTDLLQKLNLNMNLRQFFDNGIQIINMIAQYYVSHDAPQHLQYETQDPDNQSFSQMLSKLLNFRDNLFSESQIDDEKILELFVSNCLAYDDYIKDVQLILQDERLLRRFQRPNFQSFLQKIIIQKVNLAFDAKSDFKNHQKYINSMIELLDKKSTVRKELFAHLQLGLLLSVLNNPPKAPLIISIRFIEDILSNEDTQTVKGLDIHKIYQYMLMMGIQEPITNLYQVLIIKYLNQGEWTEAIKFTSLWNQHNDSISFSATVMLRVAQELPRDLRPLLVDTVILKFNSPSAILQLAKTIIDNADSKDRRRLIAQQIKKGESVSEQSYQSNTLIISEQFRELEYPFNSYFVKNLYEQLMKADMQLQNNYIYYMYYRIFMCDVEKAAEFHSKNFEFIDLKVIKTLICELSTKVYNQAQGQYLFNRPELYLFMYKCLIVLYSSNYLSKQFHLETLMRMNLEQIQSKYSTIWEELRNAMITFDVKDKLSLLRFFKKLYKKSIENVSVNPFQLSDEEGFDVGRKAPSSSSASKMYPYKTKKSLSQMILIQQNRTIGKTTNFIRQPINKNRGSNNLISKSVRSSYKPPSEEQLPDPPKMVTINKSQYQWKRSAGDQNSPSHTRKSQDFGGIGLLDSDNQDTNEVNPKRILIYEHKENRFRNSSREIKQQKVQVSNIDERSQLKIQDSRQIKNSVDLNNQNKHRVQIQQPEKQRKQQTDHDKAYVHKGNNESNAGIIKMISTESVQEVQIPSQQEKDKNLQPKLAKKQIKRSPKRQARKNIGFQKKIGDQIPFLKGPRMAQSQEQDNLKQDEIKNVKNPLVVGSDPNNSQTPGDDQSSQRNIQNRDNSLPVTSFYQSKKPNQINESVYTPNTDRQIPQFDQSKLQNSEYSSLYPMLETQGAQDNIFTINIKQEGKLIQTEKIDMGKEKIDNKIIQSAISGNLGPLLQYVKGHPHRQSQIFKSCVSQVFQIVQFVQFVSIVEKLRQQSNYFQGLVKSQNIRVIKSASKIDVNFDLKSIFTPEILYISSEDNSIDETNKLIFRYMKPKIIAILEQQNVFIIAKAIFISLHFNKSFEFRVQYYYLQKLFSELLEKQTTQQINMDLQKISVLLSKLPVNMTMQRVDKMLTPLMGCAKIETLKLLLQMFHQRLQQKKESFQGQKYSKQILECQKDIEGRLSILQKK